MIKVSIIIISYNGIKFNVDCINSVLKQSYQDFEIVFVDNNSTDGSLEQVEKEFKKEIKNNKIKIVKSKNNVGFTGGNNLGVKNSKGKYISLLNNDTNVNKDWLKHLVKAIEINDNIGLVSSLVLNYGNEQNIKDMVFKKHIKATLNVCGDAVGIHNSKYMCDIFPIFLCGGCSLLFRRSAVELPFDDIYFFYAEDNYLSQLMKIKGYDIMLATKSITYHYGGQVKKKGGEIKEVSILHGTKNVIVNYFIFYSWLNILKILPLFLVSQLGHIIYEPRKIKYKLKAWFWIINNFKYISNLRNSIQEQRTVSDKDMFKEMSYKLYDVDGIEGVYKIPVKIINFMFAIYCKVLRIKTGDL